MTVPPLPPDPRRALERFAIGLLLLAFCWMTKHTTPDVWAWLTRPMHR